jgi:hypothetical protein
MHSIVRDVLYWDVSSDSESRSRLNTGSRKKVELFKKRRDRARGAILILLSSASACRTSEETASPDRASILPPGAPSTFFASTAIGDPIRDDERPRMANLVIADLDADGLPDVIACTEYGRALERDPLDLNARNNLAVVLARQGKIEQASREWQRVPGARPVQPRRQDESPDRRAPRPR